jgi:hypothetical protein
MSHATSPPARFLLAALALAATGCMNTLRVRSTPASGTPEAVVPGIPFYKKVSVPFQETIYQESRTLVSVKWQVFLLTKPTAPLASGTLGPVLVLGGDRALRLAMDLQKEAGQAEFGVNPLPWTVHGLGLKRPWAAFSVRS